MAILLALCQTGFVFIREPTLLFCAGIGNDPRGDHKQIVYFSLTADTGYVTIDPPPLPTSVPVLQGADTDIGHVLVYVHTFH